MENIDFSEFVSACVLCTTRVNRDCFASSANCYLIEDEIRFYSRTTITATRSAHTLRSVSISCCVHRRYSHCYCVRACVPACEEYMYDQIEDDGERIAHTKLMKKNYQIIGFILFRVYNCLNTNRNNRLCELSERRENMLNVCVLLLIKGRLSSFDVVDIVDIGRVFSASVVVFLVVVVRLFILTFDFLSIQPPFKSLVERIKCYVYSVSV